MTKPYTSFDECVNDILANIFTGQNRTRLLQCKPRVYFHDGCWKVDVLTDPDGILTRDQFQVLIDRNRAAMAWAIQLNEVRDDETR